MKPALLAVLAAVLLSSTADAGLFRRRCCYKSKVVVRDCCGRHVYKSKVCHDPCCKPCCEPAKPDCGCPGEGEPGDPGIKPPGDGTLPVRGDQARCEAEAAYMAKHGIRGHVFGVIGRFEGCGWSTSGTPGTCTPPRGMRLTGDAIAKGPTGYFRVRSWR